MSTLMVRLDDESKAAIVRAAEIRGISISDYVRLVTVPQAKREAREDDRTILLTPDEYQEFWDSLQVKHALTERQKQLGARMKGEA